MTSEPTRLSRKKVIRPRPERPAGAGDASAASRPDDASVPIRTRSLTKRYGDLTAVDRLDLDVRTGEIFGLLGQNGAGKTTTILMLLGLSEPTDGAARVVGLDPARNPLEVKRRVGYMPDSVGFYTDLTGRENLRYTARLNRIPEEEAERTIDEVLEQVGLSSRSDDRTETYSRGMLQRLGIADALVKDPDILILDEPTTAIDPIGVVEILHLIRSLADERGIAVLLSSHLLDQVQSICDRVGIFHRGRLVGQGTVEELAVRFGFGTNLFEVVVDSTSESDDKRAHDILASIPGVTHVETWTGSPQVARAQEAVEGAALIAPRRQAGWTVSVDPAREHDAARAIVNQLVAEGIGIDRFSRKSASLQEIYRVAVERTGTPEHGAVA